MPLLRRTVAAVVLALLAVAGPHFMEQDTQVTQQAKGPAPGSSAAEPAKAKRRVANAENGDSTAAHQAPPACNDCNLLVVLIDTLRADHLPCYGHVRDTAPNLCAFAAENMRFKHMFANGPSTKPSVASLFTSTFPGQHKTYHNEQVLSARFETLAEVLQKQGFDTVAVNANPVIGKKFGYSQGFRQWVDLDRVTGEEVNRHVAAELPGLGKRFFLYVHYLDPHNPYSAPAPYDKYFTRGRRNAKLPAGNYPRAVPPDFPAESLETLRLKYDNEIRYVDDQFGKLLALMKAKGRYDDTIVLVVSDHGEQFGEHGYLLHSNGVHREVINVPLILRVPDAKAGAVVDSYVQHTDLLPTLTKLLSVKDDAPRMGRSVFEVKARRPIVLQHLRKQDLAAEGLVKDDLKLIRHLYTEDAQPQLFDLAADPKETRDLLASDGRSKKAAALAKQLDKIKERHTAWRKAKLRDDKAASAEREDEGENVALDADDMARLRALGYAQ